jgi:membrane protein DedA with SNARE-associated domain
MPDVMDAEPAALPEPRAGEPEAVAARPGGDAEITITRADVLCVGPIVVLMLWNLAMTPFAPGLLSHPLLLTFIRGSSSAMLAAGAAARGGSVPLWLVLIAPIPILMAADPFLYWAGRRYGRRLVDYLATQDPRWKRRMARSERWFQRFGPWAIAFGYYIPFVPATLFYLAAGESRMRIRTFAIADIAGTLTWIALHVGVGYAAGATATHIADTIARYGLWSAIAIIGLAIAWTVWNQVRLSRERGDATSV